MTSLKMSLTRVRVSTALIHRAITGQRRRLAMALASLGAVVALSVGVAAPAGAVAFTPSPGASYQQPDVFCSSEDGLVLVYHTQGRINPRGYEVLQEQDFIWSMTLHRWILSSPVSSSNVMKPGDVAVMVADGLQQYSGLPPDHYQVRTVYTWWWRDTPTQAWNKVQATADGVYYKTGFPGSYPVSDCNTAGDQTIIKIG